jgi:DNA glycosylase AlkZ-like
MRSFTWTEACARRLARHFLNAPAPDIPTAVAGMHGAHAQVMSAAEVATGLRVDGVTRMDVRDELWSKHSLVKTYGPRGTIHLFPARDLPLWTVALSAAPLARPQPPESMRMTAEQHEEVIAAIGAAVADADLTVEELDAEVVRRTGAWAGDLVMPAFLTMWPRWRQTIGLACYRGVACFGPNRGRNVTYTSPARLLPGFAPAVYGAAALEEIALRYLDSYGPATSQNFAQWLGITRPGAAKVFAALGDRIVEVSLEGNPAWLPAGDDFAGADPGGVTLLAHFDPYAVGCHPRDLLFPGRAAERGLTGGQAGTVAVMLLGGVVSGIWHQKRSGRRTRVTVEPFVKLTAAHRRELDARVERVGVVLEAKPELTIGEVTARAHL